MNADELKENSVSHSDAYEEPVVVENASFTWGIDVSSLDFEVEKTG